MDELSCDDVSCFCKDSGELHIVPDGGERSTDVVGCALKKPTLFADERGNLRFVNASVRRPCAMLCAVLAACVFTTVLFIILAAEQGVDVFSESKEYDVKDIRSIRYISLKNAIGHVQDNRDKLAAAMDANWQEVYALAELVELLRATRADVPRWAEGMARAL